MTLETVAPALELRDVAYRYPGSPRPALSDVNLRLERGEAVGIVGPNGAGKSTLCLVASGLAPASMGGELRGSVRLGGEPIEGRRPHDLAGVVGLVLSDAAAQRSGMAASVFEEVAIGPVNLGLPRATSIARTRRALDAVGLADLAERHPSRLSGGETQLMAIASMLALQPSVLVLDEPAAELDPGARVRLVEVLRSLAAAGTTMLIAEHDVNVLGATCSRILGLERGAVRFDLPAGDAEPAVDSLYLERGGTAA